MPTISPLKPSDEAAWLDFFDHRAFADHPEWAPCYCRYFLGGLTLDWDQACATRVNREPMRAGIADGTVQGLLAWEGDRVVGWTHLGPASRFVTQAGPTFPGEPDDVAAIVCFAIQADARGSGLARALLDAALVHLAAAGYREVVALGARPELDAGEQFTGPVSMYRAAGFEGEHGERRVRMRRALGG